jgi:hypothetical protein
MGYRLIGVPRSASVVVNSTTMTAQEMIMMTKFKFAKALLGTAVAIGIAGVGVTAASAQSGKAMGGMQMAPGAKMDMTGNKMAAPKPAHRARAAHHPRAAHHRSPTK